MLRAFLAVALSVRAALGAPLYDSLSSLAFLNSGEVVAGTAYSYKGLEVFYLETENVTAPAGSWGGGSPFPMLFEGTFVPPGACTTASPPAAGDRPGDDLSAAPVASDNVTLCQARCCAEPACAAWVYASSAPSDFFDCKKRGTCCYMKSGVPAVVAAGGLLTGVVGGRPGGSDNLTAPALGLRSAPPLGGLGAGSFELRGDGRFHEWTIINAYPQSAPKLPVQDDALLAMRLAPAGAAAPTSRLLRTAPPGWAPAGAGMPAMTFSGAQPVTRLALGAEAALAPYAPALYAYSVLKPGAPAEWAHPAAAFTLALRNPDAAAPLVAAFMLMLPAGAWGECARTGGAALAGGNGSSYAACQASCAATPGCVAWAHMAAACALTSTPGVSVYAAGGRCGVLGVWRSDGVTLGIDLAPAGAAGDASAGDIALRPVLEDGAACSVSTAAAAAPADLYAAFAATGALPGGPPSAAGAAVGHGAAAVQCTIPPGANATLSIVFAWHFPARVYGADYIGNFYATLFDGAQNVAAELAAPARLASVVDDIAAHHALFLASSLPTWLADTLVNEFSHSRQMLFTEAGYMRMDEAMDCPDLDSVHNDYQRHLPYLWTTGEFEVQKLKQYAVLAADGHVNENPGFFPGQSGGGRVMGDTTTIWLLEMLEIYQHTGEMTLLQELWPQVQRAATWQIQAAAEIGLPFKLECTYDIIAMSGYNSTTFNSVLHLAAMRAVEVMSAVVGDTATGAAAAASFAKARLAIKALLWNSTYGYFRAYIGGDAIMADCLYGQVVASAHGLGLLLDAADMASHLAAELKYNGNRFGLTVMTGRHTPPPIPADVRPALRHLVGTTADMQDDAVWEGAAPDWAAVALALHAADATLFTNLTAVLEPMRLQSENWRSRLNSLWDIAGLTSTDNVEWGDENTRGQSLCTSHYGFALTSYYLVYALSGQQTNIPAGKLTFAPVYACPFALPAMLYNVEGSISCDLSAGSPTYTLRLAFGTLTLPAGGLAVNGVAYTGAVVLGAGDSVSWQ